MSAFRNILFIGRSDFLHQLRQGSTLVWLLVMPPVFFYFIGMINGAGAAIADPDRRDPVSIVADVPGLLRDQLTLRLQENEFEPTWIGSAEYEALETRPVRQIVLPERFTERLGSDDPLVVRYRSRATELRRQAEILRVQQAFLTLLADAAVAGYPALTLESLAELNGTPHLQTLRVQPAGKRAEIPRGYSQSIPGILVMFTLLILLTTGSALVAVERTQGLLRRLASTPISRGEVVFGKWLGRMALASIQIAVAMLTGTLLFGMHWGPDLPMVLIVLLAWAGCCASGGLLLGSVARTDGHAAGLGVLASNALAALGGCWWPIEVAPRWMQSMQNALPTGWTMDALHKLVNFESGSASVLPQLVLLSLCAVLLGALARRYFRYSD